MPHGHGLAGADTTVSRDLEPRIVNVTFDTQPAGRTIEVFGQPFSAPEVITSWDGWGLGVNAPDQTDASGGPLTFAAWSDGGARGHTITTPAAPATYVATFTQPYARPKGASPLRAAMVVAYDACTSPDRLHGPPLSSPSCSGPTPSSDHLTVGTADSNGRATEFTGSVRLVAVPGDPATTGGRSGRRPAGGGAGRAHPSRSVRLRG